MQPTTAQAIIAGAKLIEGNPQEFYKIDGEPLKEAFKSKGIFPVQDVSVIPPERMAQMQEHAKKLIRKFPHMSQERIAKKTAAYFKVKLV